jgi:hypothetical protein
VLQAAAESGQLKIVNRLLAVNADVNAAPVRGGRTATSKTATSRL